MSEREDTCALHNIKCREMEEMKKAIRQRVPIWVFVLLVSAMSAIFTYQLSLLSTHIHNSNKILNALMHGQNEIALNQRRVMGKIALEFQELPHYGVD